jgi:hypothetical protein
MWSAPLTFLFPLEIRVVIHFLWLKDFPNVKISHKIDSIYGEMVIILRSIRNWMHYFAEESHSLEDTPRTDCPRSIKYMDAIRALLTDDPYLSQNALLSFWTFTRVESSIFYIKNYRSRKSISSGFLIFWTAIKNWKGLDFQRSSWNSSSQNQDLSLQMYIQGTKHGFVKIIRDLLCERVLDIAKSVDMRPSIGVKKVMIWVFSRVLKSEAWLSYHHKKNLIMTFYRRNSGRFR